MTAKPSYLLDANILLRFLTNDHPNHSAAAKKLYDRCGFVTIHGPIVDPDNGQGFVIMAKRVSA